jgi:hypothetical protein
LLVDGNNIKITKFEYFSLNNVREYFGIIRDYINEIIKLYDAQDKVSIVLAWNPSILTTDSRKLAWEAGLLININENHQFFGKQIQTTRQDSSMNTPNWSTSYTPVDQNSFSTSIFKPPTFSLGSFSTGKW